MIITLINLRFVHHISCIILIKLSFLFTYFTLNMSFLFIVIIRVNSIHKRIHSHLIINIQFFDLYSSRFLLLFCWAIISTSFIKCMSIVIKTLDFFWCGGLFLLLSVLFMRIIELIWGV